MKQHTSLNYYSLYALVNNPVIILVRIGCYAILTLFLIQFHTIGPEIGQKIIALYLIFILNEWFILLGINKKKPPVIVTEDHLDINSTLLRVHLDYETHSLEQFIRIAIHKKEVHVLLQKIVATYQVPSVSISKEDLLSEAAVLVRAAHGRYISYLDFFVGYLLLTEGKTQFLEHQGITRQDIEGLHYWIRNKEEVDTTRPLKLIFTGSGLFDFFVYGWDSEVKQYAINLTDAALAHKNAPVFVGRTSEYNQFIEALSNPQTNNALIIGEPGTGRETLVSYFAYESFMGYLGGLSHKKVYEVLVDRILAGINNTGELEARLGEILSQIEHSGDVAIVINNMENIFGGGGFGVNLSGVILQYLERATIPIIGITTPEAFKMYFEDKQDIKKLFEVVKIEQPDDYTAHFMVMEKSFELENTYNIAISYDAIKEFISLSISYLPDQFLPGRAIRLMNDTVTSVKMSGGTQVRKEDVEQFVQKKTNIVLTDPTDEEKQKLLHLEDKIHERLVDQVEAVSSIANAMRRLRSGFANTKRPISSFLFLGSTGVGKTELAKALAAIYFGSETTMIRLDMSEYQTQDSIKRLLGGFSQDEKSIHTLVDQVRSQPFSLLLLDEFEKAHPQILDLFLQVFDEGRLTDNQGRSVSFINCIIIATSNAGSEFIRERMEEGDNFDEIKHELINHLLSQNTFRPELLNRFDDVVMFKPLSPEDSRTVARLLLISSLKKLEEDQIFIQFTNLVLDKIVNEGYDKEFGGRNIRRFIDKNVEDFLSKEILNGKVKKGDHITLSVAPTGEFVIQ